MFDTVNATIGQGYMLVNPLQQAVMAARIASGRMLMPRLLYDPKPQQAASMGFSQEHLDFIHAAMKDVVNGPGTAGRAKLPIEECAAGRKDRHGPGGRAQHFGRGKGGQWKYRDHGHFICFAPFDKPRYACAVTIEHGGGSSSAYPIARDVMTFLFDPQKAMEVLLGMETGWGGTPQQRMETKYRTFAAKYGGAAPEVPEDEAETSRLPWMKSPRNRPNSQCSRPRKARRQSLTVGPRRRLPANCRCLALTEPRHKPGAISHPSTASASPSP